MLWVSIAEVIILAASSVFMIIQIDLLKKQLKNHHEERRRENTINFMSTWCNSVKKDTSIAEQVARNLNNEQAIKLYRQEGFEVSLELKKEICKFCPLDKNASCDTCSLKDQKKLDGKILTELRWHVISYLNTLETILVAWDLGIVDRETIEQQFSFLQNPKTGTTLSQFRNSAGGYPSIEKFIDQIKDKPSKPRAEL